jgi:hypothetical protein
MHIGFYKIFNRNKNKLGLSTSKLLTRRGAFQNFYKNKNVYQNNSNKILNDERNTNTNREKIKVNSLPFVDSLDPKDKITVIEVFSRFVINFTILFCSMNWWHYRNLYENENKDKKDE